MVALTTRRSSLLAVPTPWAAATPVSSRGSILWSTVLIPDRSGFEGPWTFSPVTFSNEYYRLLLEEPWVWRKWYVTHARK